MQQQQWSALSIKERLAPVKAFRRLLVTNHRELCEAVASDIGKEAQATIGGEVLPVADACRFLEKQAKQILKPYKIPRKQRPTWMLRQRDIVTRRPRGVVGIIGTWNYPIYLNAIPILQALTAGNTIIWKPSEVTPRSAEVLHDFLLRAGYPPDVITRMEATRENGEALVESDIDHLHFTGSASVGRKIAARLGERLISSTLELSGCDALIALPDANVKLAAHAAWFGATLNCGQTCLAVRRAWAHRTIFDEFVAHLKGFVAPCSPVELALTSQLDQGYQLIDDALSLGAEKVQGELPSEDKQDLFPPTLLVGGDPKMRMLREASFAPLLVVLPFENLDEVLKLDAECPYALGASIFTRDYRQGRELASRLSTGSVSINDVIVPTTQPVSPFGGARDSGWGVTQGREGLLEMTVPQVISEKRGTFRPYYDLAAGIDYDQEQLIIGLLEMEHGLTLFQRIRGWWKVIRMPLAERKRKSHRS